MTQEYANAKPAKGFVETIKSDFKKLVNYSGGQSLEYFHSTFRNCD